MSSPASGEVGLSSMPPECLSALFSFLHIPEVLRLSVLSKAFRGKVDSYLSETHLPAHTIHRLLEEYPPCSSTQLLRLLKHGVFTPLNYEDPALKHSKGLQFLFAFACSRGFCPVAKFLLEDPKLARLIEPCRLRALSLAARHGCAEMARLLLVHPSIDPRRHQCEALRVASEFGRDAIVAMLLADQRVQKGCHKIGTGAPGGRLRHIEKNLGGGISACDCEALRLASMNGHSSVVKLLLEAKACDSGARDSAPLRLAAERGHTEVVRLLLAQEKTDPTYKNYQALKLACAGGHVDVLKVMLNDKRVNICKHVGEDLVACAKKCGHAAIVSLVSAKLAAC